jgi:hypothetical protein
METLSPGARILIPAVILISWSRLGSLLASPLQVASTLQAFFVQDEAVLTRPLALPRRPK